MTVIYWIGQCQNTGFTFSLLQQWLCDVIFCIVHCTLLYMTIVARDITPSLEQKCPLTNFKALWLYPTRLSSRHSYSHACSDAHDVNNLHFCVIFILLSSIPFGLLESVNLSVWVFLDRFYTDFSGLSSSRSLTGCGAKKWGRGTSAHAHCYMGSSGWQTVVNEVALPLFEVSISRFIITTLWSIFCHNCGQRWKVCWLSMIPEWNQAKYTVLYICEACRDMELEWPKNVMYVADFAVLPETWRLVANF